MTLYKKKSYWINVLISLALTFGFGYLPPFGSITPLGMQAIGIFLGVLWGWLTVDLIWPGFVALIAVGLTGYMTVTEAFRAAMGDVTTIQLIFTFVFVAYLNQCGFSRSLANWFVTRKIGVNRPWVFAGLIFACAFVLSVMTFAVPAIIVCWGIFYEICEIFSLKREDTYQKLVLFGIVMSATAAALCMPYQAMSLIYISAMETAADVTVNVLTYALFRIPTSAGIVFVYWLICKYIFRPDTSKLMIGDQLADRRNIKMDTDAKIGVVAFIAFLVILLTPNFLPKDLPIISTFSSLSIVGSAMAVMIVLMIIKTQRDGVEHCFCDFMACMKDVNWTIIFLVCSVTPLATMIESEEAGIFDMLMTSLTPIAGSLGTVGFAIFAGVFAGTLTQVTHNVVLARVTLPLFIPIGAAIGVDPMITMMSMALPFQFALSTPGASANAAMVFSNGEWIDMKTAVKLVVISYILLLVYNSAIVIPLLNIFY